VQISSVAGHWAGGGGGVPGTSSVVLPASHGLGRVEECGEVEASQAEFGIFLEYLLLNPRCTFLCTYNIK
jgi:hypothetical protein